MYSRQTTYTAQSEYPASTCASARMAQGGESKMISSATSRRALMSSAILSVRKSSAALSAVVLPLITKRLSTGWLIMSASSAVPLRYSTNPAGLSPRKSPIVAGLRTSQSISTVHLPSCASATAVFSATVVLPSPGTELANKMTLSPCSSADF